MFDGRITIGELIVLLSYIAAIYSPIEQISSTIGSLHEQFVSAERVHRRCSTPTPR